MGRAISLTQVLDGEFSAVSFSVFSTLLDISDSNWRYRPVADKQQEYEGFLKALDHLGDSISCDECGVTCDLFDNESRQIAGNICLLCAPLDLEEQKIERLLVPATKQITGEPPKKKAGPSSVELEDQIAVSFMGHFMRSAFRFRGRSSRSDFFVTSACLLLVSFVWSFFVVTSAAWLPTVLFGVGSFCILLFTLIGATSVSVRRLHDFDRSGVWAILNGIPIINAVMLIIYVWVRGSPSANSFGSRDDNVRKVFGAPDLLFIFSIALLVAANPIAQRLEFSSDFTQRLNGNLFTWFGDGTYDPLQELPEALQNRLQQEPCAGSLHRESILFLRENQLRRPEAVLSERWSNECKLPTSTRGGYLLGAARAWNAIGEPQNGLAAVEKLLYLMPEEAQGLLTAASTLRTLGRYGDSISRYEAVFSLVAPSHIAHSVYMSYVDSLEKIGKGCAAYDVYHLMLDENPPSNIADVEMWMDSLEAEYKCLPERIAAVNPTSPKEHVLSVQKNGVALVKLQINGVRGTFVFDTGATRLALTTKFAKAAGIENISDEQITVKTANGEVRAHIAFVDEVNVEDVSLGGGLAVIMPPSMNSIGQDGLFGMNFISRFKVEIEKSRITLIAEN